jgi:hypothetical protein
LFDSRHLKNIIDALRDAMAAIGEHRLGIQKEIRLVVAMSMYLGEFAVYTIMLIGRWSSEVFL